MVRKRKAPPTDKRKRKNNGNGKEPRYSVSRKGMGGRPTKYDPDKHPQMVVDTLRDGKMRCHLVSALEVGIDTIWNWEKKYPEFSKAIKDGLQLSQQWWIAQAREALFLPKDLKFSAAPWIFIMKNVFGWTDKREIEQTESREIKVTFDMSGASTEDLKKFRNMPAEEKRKRIKVA